MLPGAGWWSIPRYWLVPHEGGVGYIAGPTFYRDRQVRLVAGTIVSVAVAASAAVPAVKWIAAGIGAGLTYSALSNTCGMAAVLSKLPYNRDETYDFSSTLAKLNG